MEAQASDSYPAAADHSNSAMEAQASDSYPAAADHSNSAMEAQAIVTAIQQQQQQIIATVPWKHRLVTAIQQQQIIIATVLWKCRLVAAIQQLYKLLYKSCIEAKQNNAQV